MNLHFLYQLLALVIKIAVALLLWLGTLKQMHLLSQHVPNIIVVNMPSIRVAPGKTLYYVTAREASLY